MKKIILMWGCNIKLGELLFNDNSYEFYPNFQGYKEAEADGCPIQFIYYGDNPLIKTDQLLAIFKQFIPTNERKDLVNDDFINKNDFDKLCEISTWKLRRNEFHILSEDL